MEENRRPVSSRQVPFFQNFAKTLVRLGLTPNQVSVLSAVFAFLGGWAITHFNTMMGLPFYVMAILALVGIQLRLVCNLIDGLMAVEGGLKTPTGEMYNDIPDRFSDWFLLLSAGISIPFTWGAHLGWLASILAIMTAYIRVLGASMQQGHDFGGPTAKQHRMFILNLGIIAAIIEKSLTHFVTYSMAFALFLVCIGSFLTVIARMLRLAKKLRS